MKKRRTKKQKIKATQTSTGKTSYAYESSDDQQKAKINKIEKIEKSTISEKKLKQLLVSDPKDIKKDLMKTLLVTAVVVAILIALFLS